MDYIINLDSLQGKVNELNTMKTSVVQVTNDITSGYINSVSGTEISSVINKIKASSERLSKGYNNSYNWFNRYVTEMNTLENNLSSFNTGNKVTEFKGAFVDIFSKTTMPLLKTQEEPATDDSLEAKKKAFMGDVNDSSQFYIDPNYSNKLAHMTCFDNTTGEILSDNDTLVLKPGETRILTVKLPDYCGEIDYVFRTTAQECGNGVISNKSDIDPDPNNVDYIRWEPGNSSRQFHYPSGNINLKFNTYEWIITANKDGTFLASQTCEFQSHGTDSSGKQYKYRGKKAMVAINVVVKS